jgi:uncharacterized membrane protein YhhN
MEFRTLLKIYLSFLFIECLAVSFDLQPVQFISKPSLMLILMVYIKLNIKNTTKESNLILLALIFSWFGDILLLLDKFYEFLFIYGLFSFLLAHISYIIYFWQIRKLNGNKSPVKAFEMGGVIIYSVVFYLFIFRFLEGLYLPVFFYTLVISLMLMASFHAFDSGKNQVFAKICIAGTLLFVLSDSVLAFNRFVFPIPFGSVIVIFTYGLGQCLITVGAERNLRAIALE